MTKQYDLSKQPVQPPIFTWEPKLAQQEIISAQKTITVVRECRQTGKTEVVAYLAGSALISSPHKIPIGVASFSLKNAKQVIWNRILELLHPFPSYIKHEKAMDKIVNTRTGSFIQLHGLSKEHGDSIRGHSYAGREGHPGILFIDEYQKVPYEIFVNAALPTLSAGDQGQQGWLFCIGTPSGSFDLMALMEGECDDPKNADTHIRFHYPASTLSKPPYQSHYPHLTKEFLALQKRRNPLSFAQEYEADIDAVADTTVFAQDLLSSSLTTDTPVIDHSLPVSAGLDIGVRKDLSIFVARNPHNFIAIHEVPYDGDPYGFVRRVTDLVIKYKVASFACDRGGLGESLSDMLEERLSGMYPCEECRGVIAGERAYSPANFNTRSELIALLHDFLNHQPNTISTSLQFHQELLNELSALTRKENSKGTFQLDNRQTIIEKIGHSPDVASAAALSFYFQRSEDGWKPPPETLTSDDLSKMTNREIIDAFPELYSQDEEHYEEGY